MLHFLSSLKSYKIKLFLIILVILCLNLFLLPPQNLIHNITQNLRIYSCQPNFTGVSDSKQFEFKIGGFDLNSKLRFLSHNGAEPVKLSPKENELLRLLALHENDLMPRELALTKIWRDDNYFTSRSMDVYIAKLRKYLKLDPKVEILNIHGEGFRLVVNS